MICEIARSQVHFYLYAVHAGHCVYRRMYVQVANVENDALLAGKIQVQLYASMMTSSYGIF